MTATKLRTQFHLMSPYLHFQFTWPFFQVPLLRWKRHAFLAASCILFVRAILVQLAFFAHMQVLNTVQSYAATASAYLTPLWLFLMVLLTATCSEEALGTNKVTGFCNVVHVLLRCSHSSIQGKQYPMQVTICFNIINLFLLLIF